MIRKLITKILIGGALTRLLLCEFEVAMRDISDYSPQQREQLLRRLLRYVPFRTAENVLKQAKAYQLPEESQADRSAIVANARLEAEKLWAMLPDNPVPLTDAEIEALKDERRAGKYQL